MNNKALITKIAAVHESCQVVITCSRYILSRSTCSRGLRLPRITLKVSFTFFKSVSQFDNVLIVSQMLIIVRHYLIYRENFHCQTAFSVSQFTTVAVLVPVSDSGVCIRHMQRMKELLLSVQAVVETLNFQNFIYQTRALFSRKPLSPLTFLESGLFTDLVTRILLKFNFKVAPHSFNSMYT